ncbi:MAG: hypothetical protein ACKV2V_21425 [Blastocatellia bacterium]
MEPYHLYRHSLLAVIAITLLCLVAPGQELSAPQSSPAPLKPSAQAPDKTPKPTPTPQTPARRPQQTELQKALQEFRVQMGQAGSDKGGALKGAGKQNALTGRVYEYLRNDFLDALPHEVRQRGGTKSLLRRNQYGFSVSGPVRFPFLYDGRNKTFFSVSFEATRERIAQSALYTLPTDAQRDGAFADLVDTAGNPVTIYDPATTRLNPQYDPSQPVSAANLQYLRDPFPGNTIPRNRIDPVALQLVPLYPRANASVGPFLQNNYFINSPYENRASGVIGKLDHALTAKQQFSVNLTTSSGLRKSPELFPGPANSGRPAYNFDNRSVTLSDTWTVSPRTIWTFRLSARHDRTITEEAARAGSVNYPARIGLTGVFSNLLPALRFSNYLGIGPQTDAILRENSYSFWPSAAASLTRGAHTWRVNGYFLRSFSNSFAPEAPAGMFSFGTSLTGLPGVRNTGNPFASFLLGLVTRGEETIVPQPSYWRKNYGEFNLTDEWRVRQGLTITTFLSGELSGPRREKYNRQSNISLTRINPGNGYPGAMVFAGRDGAPAAFQPTTFRLEPHFGIAWSPRNDRHTVIRLNYDLTYQNIPLIGRHFGTQGFTAQQLFFSTNEQLQPAFTLRNGVPVNFPAPPYLDPRAADGTEPDFLVESDLLPSTQDWTLTAQRELPGSFSVEARLNYQHGAHLFSSGLARINAVPLRALAHGEKLYDEAFRASLRRFPQYRVFGFGGLNPAGDSRLSSLALSLDKRLSAGVYGRVSYRRAKWIENASAFAQNPDNAQIEMSLSPSDITHSMSASWTWEIPLGAGRAWLNDGALIGRALGGWNISVLSTLRGGTPLILRPLFNRTGNVVSSLHVNVVPGVSPYAAEQTSQSWFNPAAFAQPDDFTIGNASRTHPQLRNPGDQFHHMSLTKRMEIHADTSMELLVEAFNFPNHANLNDPDTRIGPASSPNLNAGKIIGSTGGRVLQLGLRLLF